MKQIVIKVYHIRIIDRTRADGDGYQNHGTIHIKNNYTNKKNYTNNNVNHISKNKKLTKVVPATGAIDNREDKDTNGTALIKNNKSYINLNSNCI